MTQRYIKEKHSKTFKTPIFDYSTSFSSVEEQHAVELKEIGKRLKDFGVGGYLHFVKNQRETILTDASDGEDLARLSIQKSPERGTVLCSLDPFKVL